MRAVNLLPADAYQAKPKLPYASVVLAATAPVLASALVYLGYSLEHSKVADRQIALDTVQSQVESRSPSQTLVAAAATILSEKTSHQLELEDALRNQMPWDVAFDQIARVLPANTWLTNVTMNSPTPVSAGGSAASAPCTITGYAMTQADVAHILARLTLVPVLSKVGLGSVTVAVVGKTNVLQFTINATVAKVSA